MASPHVSTDYIVPDHQMMLSLRGFEEAVAIRFLNCFEQLVFPHKIERFGVRIATSACGLLAMTGV